MRALVQQSFGDPAGTVSVVDVPTPSPGPGQVLVRMLLSPIHNHDLMGLAGDYAEPAALPRVPGTEAVGVVEALGDGVTAPAVGQRVAGGAAATWAEAYVAGAAGLLPVPDDVADEAAAQLVSMPLSAQLLLDEYDPGPDGWFVANAANGAVGRALAMLGRPRGTNLVGLVRRDAALDELAALGVDRVVSTETAGWQDRLRAMTGGQPVRVALDQVAGAATAGLLEVLADQGTLLSFGRMSHQPLVVPAQHLLFRGITVKGFWLAAHLRTADRRAVASSIAALVGHVRDGSLVLPADGTYELGSFTAAVAAHDRPGRPGPVLLRAAPG